MEREQETEERRRQVAEAREKVIELKATLLAGLKATTDAWIHGTKEEP